jgi:hypothetical protein
VAGLALFRPARPDRWVRPAPKPGGRPLTTLPAVRLGIIPFDADPPVGPLHGFYLYDNSLVLVELFTAELNITQAGELGAYERVFGHLASAAVYGPAVRELLTRTLTAATS